MAETGVSLIVCCHNSAQRLPPTLEHLKAQQVRPGLRWEVLIIDNASTDETAQVAGERWKGSPVPFRVVPEPKAGLMFARWRGAEAAQFELLSFIDDDNWMPANWVERVAQIMSEHPEVGACNGWSVAQLDREPPSWFPGVQGMFAISTPKHMGGDITWTGTLWGAGLTIRRTAFLSLREAGFTSGLVGRQGSALTSGEDQEVCLALRLAGWHWWRDTNLRFGHAISPHRIDWQYTRRLFRAAGNAIVVLDAFEKGISGRSANWMDRIRETWYWQAIYVLEKIAAGAGTYLKAWRSGGEGDGQILKLEVLLGRLEALIRWRGGFQKRTAEIRILRSVLQNTKQGRPSVHSLPTV